MRKNRYRYLVIAGTAGDTPEYVPEFIYEYSDIKSAIKKRAWLESKVRSAIAQHRYHDHPEYWCPIEIRMIPTSKDSEQIQDNLFEEKCEEWKYNIDQENRERESCAPIEIPF